MAKITVEQLQAKMADPTTVESELAQYFTVDEDASAAFAPRLRLNPATVQIPRTAEAEQRTAALMNSANWFARLRRQVRFQNALAKGYDGPLIVSDGDSWFQYPLLLKDMIDHLLDHYAILSLGAAGDLLKRMADKQEYLRALRDTGAEILLLSGGGNDLVAGGGLTAHLEEFHPDLMPEDYLLPSFHDLLDDALTHYGRMFTQVRDAFPHVTILCHGYDYPVPNRDRWLGKPMERRGIRDRGLQKSIAACMMDHFNRRLRRLAASMPHVTYIDCRGVVGDHRWHDGLHPTDEGYADVAAKFKHEISALSNARSSPPVVISGPFGTASQLSRALGAPSVIAGGQATGYSLHVGLNTVDPGHYDGWDGRLLACEADALAMETLAAAEGFTPARLLTSDATRANVTEEIRRAARDLKAGDMFLMTVSGHGGRIPDFNMDEDHDGDQKFDETLCLYDFQLADDELYMLWSEFRAGVRVLVVADTCHSGSMIKVGPAPMPTALFGRPIGPPPGARAMPLHIEDRVWRANEAAYRSASDSFSALKESVLTNPLSTPVKASVLNMGACKDTQFAMDGAQNGAFTGALLRVWDNGRFKGDYHDLRAATEGQIGSPSQTPQLFDKLVSNPDFTTNRPFTLQPRAGRPAAQGSTPPVPRPVEEQMSSAEEEGDGEARDQISAEEVEAILSAKARGAGFRDSQAALTWSGYAEFDAFISSLGLKHFATGEFLVLGGGHNTPGGPCAGKNTYPPRHLWSNIASTARVLDQLRDRLGKPIAITNAYRGPAYNSCIGGAAGSQHMQFTALDFQVRGMAAPGVAHALRYLRDKEGLFKGGIGRYNSFIHVDTRGYNATWPKAFRDSPLASSPPLGPPGPGSLTERLAMIGALDLAPTRSRRAVSEASVFSEPVNRSHDSFDPSSALAAQQQALSAAVNASSVISFVDNLTPGQKEDVLLSTLFAQRAADAKSDPVAEREAWFTEYMRVLGLLGWVREEAPFTASETMQGSGSFEKVILSTLAQVATANQFEIVKSAIGALRGLADDDGTIKLFDFETSKTSGSNFQIGTAEASVDIINIALGAFNFTYSDSKKNILFVSWGAKELKYWLAAQNLSLSPAIYDTVRKLVASRLSEVRKAVLADISLV
ncbi:caspase family protein [Leisingera aquaemixtae]|uniref:D-Ala-D-Ala carboxypeptidase family metallohydrolase n=1 Tax=Leisingera aquaemixtae TaxID=1396826 RepID=UPI0021A93807|nr:D-Ala-D-Ala carboxypeptidase family metallohydrolase [Leisingera aquaemixtae]UWQ36633.1 caspase family protein [Leisingera aquaemixtae]